MALAAPARKVSGTPLAAAVEKTLRDADLFTSWATVREQLSTHQVVTINLPTTDGRTLTIRRATAPEEVHLDLYRRLKISPEVITPVTRLQATIVTQPQRNPLKS